MARASVDLVNTSKTTITETSSDDFTGKTSGDHADKAVAASRSPAAPPLPATTHKNQPDKTTVDTGYMHKFDKTPVDTGHKVEPNELMDALANQRLGVEAKAPTFESQPGGTTADASCSLPRTASSATSRRASPAPAIQCRRRCTPPEEPEGPPAPPPLTAWKYGPPEARALRLLAAPDLHTVSQSGMLQPGAVFRVSGEFHAADSTLYLKLAGGRGWTFEAGPRLGVLCKRLEGWEMAELDADAATAPSAPTVSSTLERADSDIS